jgi:hypothetical protein
MWKDSLDSDMYHLGVKYTISTGLAIWTSMHCDAVSDMFGAEFFKQIKDATPSRPFHVTVSLELD